MTELTEKKCEPCEGKTAPLTKDQAQALQQKVSSWSIIDEAKKIKRQFVFNNFVQAVEFVNNIADIAESENHHPDIFIHGYKNVDVTLSTHAIQGLSENDFIVAAKVDLLGK